MKKLYRKGTVHPSPPPVSDQLSFLPAAILTLAAALSPEDKEVLAYLILCSSGNPKRSQKVSSGRGGGGSGGDHPPSFNCNCFRCYMSYWARWDSSPNRQLIHEIIDAFEDTLAGRTKRDKGKRERKKKAGAGQDESKRSELSEIRGNEKKPEKSISGDSKEGGSGSGGVVGGREDEEKETAERGPVRKLVSFVGERIWSVWTRG